MPHAFVRKRQNRPRLPSVSRSTVLPERSKLRGCAESISESICSLDGAQQQPQPATSTGLTNGYTLAHSSSMPTASAHLYLVDCVDAVDAVDALDVMPPIPAADSLHPVCANSLTSAPSRQLVPSGSMLSAHTSLSSEGEMFGSPCVDDHRKLSAGSGDADGDGEGEVDGGLFLGVGPPDSIEDTPRESQFQLAFDSDHP